jgi:hypothetical protein
MAHTPGAWFLVVVLSPVGRSIVTSLAPKLGMAALALIGCGRSVDATNRTPLDGGPAAAEPVSRRAADARGDAAPRPDADSVALPSGCVPSCISAAFLSCSPPQLDLCYEERLRDAYPAETALCSPETGWFRIEVEATSTGALVSVGQWGEPCFSARFGGKGGTGLVVYSGHGPTGTSCSYDGRADAYVLEDPDCAPYVYADFLGTPVVSPAFECATIVPGSCASAATPP